MKEPSTHSIKKPTGHLLLLFHLHTPPQFAKYTSSVIVHITPSSPSLPALLLSFCTAYSNGLLSPSIWDFLFIFSTSCRTGFKKHKSNYFTSHLTSFSCSPLLRIQSELLSHYLFDLACAYLDTLLSYNSLSTDHIPPN